MSKLNTIKYKGQDCGELVLYDRLGAQYTLALPGWDQQPMPEVVAFIVKIEGNFKEIIREPIVKLVEKI
jgi:hypothetical protein